MKPEKKFDCVQMKKDIQKKIAEEFAGIPEKEAWRIQMEQIFNDPILGPITREKLAEQSKHPRKAIG